MELFPEAQIINLGTLDNPDDVDVSIEMFSDEAMKCIAHNPSHTIYHHHRLNKDGTPAKPKIV